MSSIVLTKVFQHLGTLRFQALDRILDQNSTCQRILPAKIIQSSSDSNIICWKAGRCHKPVHAEYPIPRIKWQAHSSRIVLPGHTPGDALWAATRRLSDDDPHQSPIIPSRCKCTHWSRTTNAGRWKSSGAAARAEGKSSKNWLPMPLPVSKALVHLQDGLHPGGAGVCPPQRHAAQQPG